ncbi:MAG: GNAT family N-acetyltransferase [Planctomycetia bacterium]|nr:GNAT family N-acetyltransferase [Planctomycetia bacterium]
MLDPDDSWRVEWRATSAMKCLRDEYADHHYLSLAVGNDDRRVPDVDIMLNKRCNLRKLLAALNLLIDRARYYSRPAKCPEPSGLKIRAINSQAELRDAFKLRYAVYRVMGYLSEDAMDIEQLMELDGCDCWSNHFGAFVAQPDGSQTLVGTARLIMTRNYDDRYKHWTNSSATTYSLKKLLERRKSELVNFRLPIFLTLPLNDEMTKAFKSIWPWAELSRVIVAPEYRGAEIGRSIIEFAVSEADRLNTESVLLECLELHRPMYEKMEFQPLGRGGVVMGVGKTMVGMQRMHPKLAEICQTEKT